MNWCFVVIREIYREKMERLNDLNRIFFTQTKQKRKECLPFELKNNKRKQEFIEIKLKYD